MKLHKPELAATVREIAARTQVPSNRFTTCPNEGCDATIADDLHITEVTIPTVEYHCHRCGELGELDSWKVDVAMDESVSARQLFHSLV